MFMGSIVFLGGGGGVRAFQMIDINTYGLGFDYRFQGFQSGLSACSRLHDNVHDPDLNCFD